MRKMLLTLITAAQCIALVAYALGSRRLPAEFNGALLKSASRFTEVERMAVSPARFEPPDDGGAIKTRQRDGEPNRGSRLTNEVGYLAPRHGGASGAQQPGVDPSFNPMVARPAYIKSHPKVLFDEAHNNADTSRGRYKPFADMIASDGYAVAPNAQRFSKEALKGYGVLVIVNAAAQSGVSPFAENEMDAVRDWVNKGGALLLITDNAPYSFAAAQLSKRFDVDISQGYLIDSSRYNKDSEDQTELVFTREDGLVAEHPITRGRDATEQVKRIMTFTGVSIKGPPKSVAFLKLADTAMDVQPPDRKPSSNPEDPLPEHKPVSAAGRAQGIALEFGQGRVVVLGDAAMLTAQVGSRGYRFGMNVSGVDNRQLGLNLIHWLSGLLK